MFFNSTYTRVDLCENLFGSLLMSDARVGVTVRVGLQRNSFIKMESMELVICKHIVSIGENQHKGTSTKSLNVLLVRQF
jgi:hypothetical protein